MNHTSWRQNVREAHLEEQLAAATERATVAEATNVVLVAALTEVVAAGMGERK